MKNSDFKKVVENEKEILEKKHTNCAGSDICLNEEAGIAAICIKSRRGDDIVYLIKENRKNGTIVIEKISDETKTFRSFRILKDDRLFLCTRDNGGSFHFSETRVD